MVLIVETGSGLSNAESYASVAYAESYVETHEPSAASAWIGVAASGSVTIAVNPTDGDTVSIGGKTYTLQSTLTDVDGNVQIGADAAATLSNLSAALGLSGTAGTNYAASMTANTVVASGGIAGNRLDLTAAARGTGGNTAALTSTFTDSVNNTVSGALLSGGANPTLTLESKEQHLRRATRHTEAGYRSRWRGFRSSEQQALDWPRYFARDDDDFPYEAFEIPPPLREFVVILAIQLGAGVDILPDATTGSIVLDRSKVKIGPLEIDESLGAGGQGQIPLFRLAERIIGELIFGGGTQSPLWKG